MGLLRSLLCALMLALAGCTGREAASERPNILLIVVDTLRWDRLTPYGYGRATTPEIARWIAGSGIVVEEAYSQAPWTLPSVISYLTGRYPGELLSSEVASFGIPEGVPTLAERLARLGYTTGAFVANPTLHAGAGFARGFETFYVPPAVVESLHLHGDELNRRALPWLEAHRDRPFFLYLHYIDPHDPYDNPDVVDGRSPFFPGYRGPVRGDWVHGIYSGALTLPDPRNDVAHLSALYDSEVRYVDRLIGALLASLPAEVLAETLIVLTSDHGEELYDHGGWKHGQTLYEEQIHVPLLLRWDGGLPAGKRLQGTVRLLDLMPTLAAAAGGGPDPSWDGVDLLPALTGSAPLPRRPAFAQHLSGGPLRAAAVSEQEKLILFNPREPYQPADALWEHLWKKDLQRLERIELYDLAKDPRERANRAAAAPARVRRLAPVLHGHLEVQLPGVRVLAEGVPAGSRLTGSVTFERAPGRWIPYLLRSGDRVDLAGSRLRFDLAGDLIAKGLRIEGEPGRVLAVEARLDGQPLPPGSVLTGRGIPYTGGSLDAGDLRSPHWPVSRPAGAGAVLRIWLPPNPGPGRRIEVDPETERRLRALGYIE
jgi:arylsulfatase A-like enzyme